MAVPCISDIVELSYGTTATALCSCSGVQYFLEGFFPIILRSFLWFLFLWKCMKFIEGIESLSEIG